VPFVLEEIAAIPEHIEKAAIFDGFWISDCSTLSPELGNRRQEPSGGTLVRNPRKEPS
jgi:hypothetical protein